jgi:IS5 family transposase
MRVVQNSQMLLGQIAIAEITFDPRSRDDIPKILRGLQHVYLNAPLRNAIFALLETEIAPKVSKTQGRPGMPLWTILVCGVLRLDLNTDYDRLHELVNHHDTLRQMLGHSPDYPYTYAYQTLVDNVNLLTPELLDKINTLVVKEGHLLLKKGDAALRGRCDSFVVKTDVHYPTDITLLYDALRKAITLTAQWCDQADCSEWRQYRYQIHQVKRLVRSAQNHKRRNAKAAVETSQKPHPALVEAHRLLIEQAREQLTRVKTSVARLENLLPAPAQKARIEDVIRHAERQIDQIHRRVIQGETIAHAEKVFSIYEPHTEWIVKGKAGVPVELGVRVCVMEDQYRFIVHHRVMTQETDEKVALPMVSDTQRKFADFNACSFDKGFHSPDNQTALKTHLAQVTLPRKGKLAQQAKADEQADAFVKARRAHSAVESAINALQVHGLDKCPDHGLPGFKRYVAFAVLARNIHRLGDIVWQRDAERERRRQAALRGNAQKQAA